MKIVAPTGLPPLDMNRVDPRLREAAQGMEEQFVLQMLRTMRNSVEESEETKANQSLQLFRGMLDEHYAGQAARQGNGIGIADMVIRYLLQKDSVPLESGKPSIPDESAAIGNKKE